MDAAWIAEYRRETDRNRRRAILDREEADRPSDAAIELRRKLWAGRYEEKKGQEIDIGIRGWVELMGMKRRIYLPGEKNRIRRDLDEIKRDWQFALCEEYGEIGERALYDELFNVALLYMELCDRDRTYNSVFLGLGHISEKRRVEKIRSELREMAMEIPETLKIREELSVFTRAVQDAFAYRYPAEAGLSGKKE